MTVALPEAPTVADLLGKLEALGSHKQIAMFLAERGIVGTPSCAGTCPIAHYLQEEMGNPEIHVGEDDVAVWHSGAVVDEVVRLPSVVKDFIAFFDARLHPELIDPQRPARSFVLAGHPSGAA